MGFFDQDDEDRMYELIEMDEMLNEMDEKSGRSSPNTGTSCVVMLLCIPFFLLKRLF